jgi:hypothetical protein
MNLDELTAIARAATPGPYEFDGGIIYAPGVRLDKPEGGGPFMLAQIRGWGHLQYLGEEAGAAMQDANGKHIATFSPALVLRLLDIVRKADEMREWVAGLEVYFKASGGVYDPKRRDFDMKPIVEASVFTCPAIPEYDQAREGLK